MPLITGRPDGSSIWSHRYDSFEATVYSPVNDKDDDILNYGFIAPYLLVFTPEKFSADEAIAFARERGLEKLASDFATSIVFIYPTAAGGWDNAPDNIFAEILTNSKIHQYYKNGMAICRDRFFRAPDEYHIRGAIFRTNLFGFGKSADYIAANCLKHFEGDGLWGRADCAAVTCILTGLSTSPVIAADDIPVISVGNSDEINQLLGENIKYLLVDDKGDYYGDFYSFSRKFRRMLGQLELDAGLEAEGMVIEPGIETVPTSVDNMGDDKGTAEHRIGYFAYYNRDIFEKGPAPLLLAFHGGGDSAFYISHVSRWADTAHKYGFLLVSIENHLNSTAAEMVTLIERLKQKYSIDPTRIYCSGFSMGGCKSWDFVGEFPSVLAAAAPMDATFEMGLNVFGKPSAYPLNTTVPVPVFYAGGEITPLPELPFQEKKCYDRIKYILELNHADKPYNVSFEDRASWPNKIWGIDGDYRTGSHDPERNADLNLELFTTGDKCYTVLGCITGQGHECRPHTCENAWRFLSCFRRLSDGTIEGGDLETVKNCFTK